MKRVLILCVFIAMATAFLQFINPNNSNVYAGKIYYWTDENGVKNASTSPPPASITNFKAEGDPDYLSYEEKQKKMAELVEYLKTPEGQFRVKMYRQLLQDYLRQQQEYLMRPTNWSRQPESDSMQRFRQSESDYQQKVWQSESDQRYRRLQNDVREILDRIR